MSGRLIDAILVARDLLNRHPDVTAQRLDAHPLLKESRTPRRGVFVYEGEVNLRAAVVRDAGRLSRSGSFLLDLIWVPASAAEVVRSDDGRFKSPDRVMRSLLLRYPDRARIRILDNLNACWKRFAACKELAHLIMGEHGQRAANVEQQLAMALTICRSAQPEQELTGEEFAWFVAAELMFPKQDRKELLNRRARGEDSLAIARSYWAPKAIVDMLFETPYGKLSNES